SNAPSSTPLYTLSLHDALPICTDPVLLENEVIFEGDRLETSFSNIPGQWGTVWLTDGSTANELNYLTIKNATVGILMDHNDGTSDRKSTRLNSSHVKISYAVFC